MGASAGRIRRPSTLSGKPNSCGEHIIPWLVMPKTFRSLMTNGSFSPAFSGRAKFGRMSGTLSPGLWFCAPQMMVRSPLPSLTLQTESLSEPDTLSLVRICATTMPSNSPLTLVTLSTSSPSMVNRSASCSADQSKSTYCFSQLNVTFMSCQELELAQEPHVVLVKQPDVVDAVAKHGDALDTEAESPSGPDFRIVANILEDLRMHHAAAG